MTSPVRLQLSRRKGFNLQAHSLAINGLPAVNVARPHRMGNPYRVGKMVDKRQVARWSWKFSLQGLLVVCLDNAEAARRFRHVLFWDEAVHDWLRQEVGGKNVACFCGLTENCHGDSILAVANSTPDQVSALHYEIDQRIIDEARAFEELANR